MSNNQVKYITQFNQFLPILKLPQYREKFSRIGKTHQSEPPGDNFHETKVTVISTPQKPKHIPSKKKPEKSKKISQNSFKEGIILCGTEASISNCEKEIFDFFGIFKIQKIEISTILYEAIKFSKVKSLREISEGYLNITPYWGRAEITVIYSDESKLNLLQQELHNLNKNYSTFMMKIDSQFAANKLLGKNGSNLASIRSQCSCKITLTLSSELIIIGSPNEIQKAKKLVYSSLGKLSK